LIELWRRPTPQSLLKSKRAVRHWPHSIEEVLVVVKAPMGCDDVQNQALAFRKSSSKSPASF
jgi:hypothetical protein